MRSELMMAGKACVLVCYFVCFRSATVVREPQAWTKTVARLKAEIVAGRDDADLLMPNLKVGVSTNFNKLVRAQRV